MRNLSKVIVAIVIMTAAVFAAGCTPEENHDSDVKVTTYTPQDITATTAVCGGDVIATQGLSLTELGVCWGTSGKPTVEDSHFSTSNWSEPYVCTLTGLEPNTKYHVRAYALRGLEYYYGNEKSFTTESIGGGGGGFNGHDYVDLGLPSGTLWATCNVGANTSEEYGDFFAWGETEPKTIYDWSTYKYCNGDYDELTKYCNYSYYGCDGFTDNLTVLQSSDDVVTANWGSDWCMPTADQWEELYQNTTDTWTTKNGVNGRLFTASNGKSLFLPAGGSRCNDELFHIGTDGSYWSSSLSIDYPYGAWYFHFGLGGCGMLSGGRHYGSSVRPVRQN